MKSCPVAARWSTLKWSFYPLPKFQKHPEKTKNRDTWPSEGGRKGDPKKMKMFSCLVPDSPHFQMNLERQGGRMMREKGERREGKKRKRKKEGRGGRGEKGRGM